MKNVAQSMRIVVTTHETGNTINRTLSEWNRANTVNIQTIRSRHVPVIVITAGSTACPVPRRIPAGTSYNPQTGSKASINAILRQAAAHTAESEENKPANCVLKTVIGTVIKALNKIEKRVHFIKICTQRFICLAA